MSPTTGKTYPLTLACEAYRVPRSTVYAWQRTRNTPSRPLRKRGPRTRWSDEELLVAIREVLRTSPFLSEGHRKVRVRLRPLGIRAGKNRVLRLMRENGLLAPHRRRHAHGDRAHAGSIVTEQPNELWGADATRFYTRKDGWVWFFGAIDHFSQDIVGWHVAKKGISVATPGRSPWDWACVTTGDRSTRPINFSASYAGSGSARRQLTSASRSATASSSVGFVR